MIHIRAPYPDFEAIIFLPSPFLGDGERPESRIQVKKAMDGTTVTHVTQKQLNAIHYQYTFSLTRMKALELKAFIDLYVGKKWEIVWPGRANKVVYLLVNPIQLDMAQRAVLADSVEAVNLELEFESVE